MDDTASTSTSTHISPASTPTANHQYIHFTA
jgi:hypothetical protein